MIIDNRNNTFPKKNHELIRHFCDRKFGIGADGLMLLENSDQGDFKMIYFNADGREGSMCGNGGRCMVAFAKSLGIFDQITSFEAMGEMYHARLKEKLVSLQMTDVKNIEVHPEHVFLNTGSPHHIMYTENLSAIDVFNRGREIRYGAPYNDKGTNVNFVQKINENTFKVSEYKLTTGIFLAKLIHDNWTLIGDTNYNYTFDQEYCIPATCLDHKAANSIDYSAGFLWSPIRYADFLVKYNQEIGTKDDEWHWKDNNIDRLSSRKNTHYYELATFINLKYIKPSITYTLRPEGDNYVEFGLAFDF